jgi:hypothetical protein
LNQKESWTQIQTQIIVRWNIEYQKDKEIVWNKKWGFFIELKLDNNNKDFNKLITYPHNMRLSKKERWIMYNYAI